MVFIFVLTLVDGLLKLIHQLLEGGTTGRIEEAEITLGLGKRYNVAFMGNRLYMLLEKL